MKRIITLILLAITFAAACTKETIPQEEPAISVPEIIFPKNTLVTAPYWCNAIEMLFVTFEGLEGEDCEVTVETSENVWCEYTHDKGDTTSRACIICGAADEFSQEEYLIIRATNDGEHFAEHKIEFVEAYIKAVPGTLYFKKEGGTETFRIEKNIDYDYKVTKVPSGVTVKETENDTFEVTLEANPGNAREADLILTCIQRGCEVFTKLLIKQN